MLLSFDLCEKGKKISNIAKALCIWDFNVFDDCGVFGRMPDGWFKAQNPFLESVILMTFTGGAGRGEWVLLDDAGKPIYDFSVPLRVLKNVLRQGVRPIIVIGNVPYALSSRQLSEYDSYEWGNFPWQSIRAGRSVWERSRTILIGGHRGKRNTASCMITRSLHWRMHWAARTLQCSLEISAFTANMVDSIVTARTA